eukprot:261607_1
MQVLPDKTITFKLYEGMKRFYKKCKIKKYPIKDNFQHITKQSVLKTDFLKMGPVHNTSFFIMKRFEYIFIEDNPKWNPLKQKALPEFGEIFKLINFAKIKDKYCSAAYCKLSKDKKAEMVAYFPALSYKCVFTCLGAFRDVLESGADSKTIEEQVEELKEGLQEILGLEDSVFENAKKGKVTIDMGDTLSAEKKIHYPDKKNATKTKTKTYSNKFNVVENQFEKYLEKNYPNIWKLLNFYKHLIQMTLWIIGDQYPPLRYLKYYPERRIQAYKPSDLLFYGPGHVVNGHVDIAALLDQSVPLHVVHYAVGKINTKSKSQILCNCWKKGNCCCYKKNEKFTNSGGHTRIESGDWYVMYGRGVFGGASHAIHDDDNDSGKKIPKFVDESITVVFRPKGELLN